MPRIYRFIFLEDCEHVVISKAIDLCFSQSAELKSTEVGLKCCPLCQTPIVRTWRFANEVKNTYEHIRNVKKKIHGNEQSVLELKAELSEALDLILAKTGKLVAHTSCIAEITTTSVCIFK